MPAPRPAAPRLRDEPHLRVGNHDLHVDGPCAVHNRPDASSPKLKIVGASCYRMVLLNPTRTVCRRAPGNRAKPRSVVIQAVAFAPHSIMIHQVDPDAFSGLRGLSGGHLPAEPAGCVDQLGAGGQPVIARLLADATGARPP
jgi:hypothetical protein